MRAQLFRQNQRDIAPLARRLLPRQRTHRKRELVCIGDVLLDRRNGQRARLERTKLQFHARLDARRGDARSRNLESHGRRRVEQQGLEPL